MATAETQLASRLLATEMAAEREVAAALRAEAERLRAELATMIEVQQSQQGSAVQQAGMHLKAALAQASSEMQGSLTDALSFGKMFSGAFGSKASFGSSSPPPAPPPQQAGGGFGAPPQEPAGGEQSAWPTGGGGGGGGA